MIIDTPVCIFCGDTGTIEVNDEDYALYALGYDIQRAFPSLSVDEREQILSGTHVGECSEAWDTLFEDMEDEE